jgi:hypothetical protein
VEDNTEQGAVNLQDAVVVDETQLPELVHEMIDSGAGGSYHRGQSILADPRNDWFGFAFFAELRQQQKYSSQALFAGVEDLIDEVFFHSKSVSEEIRGEKVCELAVLVEEPYHGLLIKSNDSRWCDCRSRGEAKGLTGQASLTEKATIVKKTNDRFFSLLRLYGKLNLAVLNAKYSVSIVSLREYDPLPCRVVGNGVSRLDFGYERFEIERLGLLACQDTPPSGESGVLYQRW